MVWKVAAAALAGLLLVAPRSFSQSPQVVAALDSTTCPGTGCATLAVSSLGSVAVQITGTWIGTISFEGSINGATYVPLLLTPTNSVVGATSTTTNGTFNANAGGLAFARARFSAYTSGTAQVVIQASKGQPATAAADLQEFTETPQEGIPPGADGVLVTPSAVDQGLSNWFELSPDIGGADIALASIVVNQGVNNVGYCAMLGVGAAAAEVQVAQICANALSEANGTRNHVLYFQPPQVIAANSRLSVRMQKSGTNVTQWGFSVTYYDMPMIGNPVSTTANNTSINTTVAVNTTAWANSNWAQTTASTSTDWVIHHVGIIAPCVNMFYQIEIGTGGAGSEVVKWTGQGLFAGNTSCLLTGSPATLPVVPALRIPQGTRVAIRVRKSDTGGSNWFPWLTYYPSSSGLSKIYTQEAQQWAVGLGTACTGAGTMPGAEIPNNTSVSWGPSAWTEVIASTAGQVGLTSFFEYTNGAISGERIYEIGVGAASSEVVVGQIRALTGSFTGDWHTSTIYPAIQIGSGQRVAVRMRMASTTATTNCVNVGYIANPDFAQLSNKTSGTWPDNAQGVQPAPGGTAWTNGAWVELVSTTGAGRKLATHLVTQIGGGVPREWEVDIGSGTVGNEVVVTSYRGFTGNIAAGTGSQVDRFVVPQQLPSNTRLAVRARGSGTNTALWRVAVRWVQK